MSFFTFLIGRVIYQIYIVFAIAIDWVYWEYMKKNLTLYKALVVTEMAIMVILSIVLNSYWFILMINMIIRMIKKLQAPKDKDEETIELVKADALAEDADCGSSTQGSNIDNGEIVEENNTNGTNSQDRPEAGFDIWGRKIVERIFMDGHIRSEDWLFIFFMF